MFHTWEDEEKLFKKIEESSKRIEKWRKEDEDKKFNKLIKKAEEN